MVSEAKRQTTRDRNVLTLAEWKKREAGLPTTADSNCLRADIPQENSGFSFLNILQKWGEGHKNISVQPAEIEVWDKSNSSRWHSMGNGEATERFIRGVSCNAHDNWMRRCHHPHPRFAHEDGVGGPGLCRWWNFQAPSRAPTVTQ